MPPLTKHSLLVAIAASHIFASVLMLTHLIAPAHDLLIQAAPIILSAAMSWTVSGLAGLALLWETIRVRSILAGCCAFVQVMAASVKWGHLVQSLHDALERYAPYLLDPGVQIVVLASAILASVVALILDWNDEA